MLGGEVRVQLLRILCPPGLQFLKKKVPLGLHARLLLLHGKKNHLHLWPNVPVEFL